MTSVERLQKEHRDTWCRSNEEDELECDMCDAIYGVEKEIKELKQAMRELANRCLCAIDILKDYYRELDRTDESVEDTEIKPLTMPEALLIGTREALKNPAVQRIIQEGDKG